MMTLLLLRSENMVILVLLRHFCRYYSEQGVILYFAEPIRNTFLYSLESSSAASERLWCHNSPTNIIQDIVYSLLGYAMQSSKIVTMDEKMFFILIELQSFVLSSHENR